MKIGGFVKNSFVDYPAHISSVIFTSGCNMNCWYCHNKQLIPDSQESANLDNILDFITSRKNFLDGVVISGGEPTLQPDLKEVIKKIKGIGLKVKLDTNGSNFEILKDLIDNNLVDFVAMDIKAPVDQYEKITGTNAFNKSIRQCIDLLINGNIDYEFRTTYAPNLTLDDIENLAKDIKGAKKLMLQCCRFDNEKVAYMPHKPSVVQKAVEIASKYVKNVGTRGY